MAGFRLARWKYPAQLPVSNGCHHKSSSHSYDDDDDDADADDDGLPLLLQVYGKPRWSSAIGTLQRVWRSYISCVRFVGLELCSSWYVG